jgi:hypothetical protein
MARTFWLFTLVLAIASTKPTRAAERHWAFEPVRRPSVPKVEGLTSKNPIDAFLLARLRAEGVAPSGPADRRTLLRRVTLDLTGLPPTIAEQDAFLGDTSADAYARLVGRLLARPEYGERWARHWLDVARYAESNGYERDGAKPDAWRYRDWVIDGLNADMPYDRFLVEQLAGDEVERPTPASRIAATFLRLGTWDDEPAEPLVDRYDQLDDVLGTTATAFLGITLRCARCHDHKFEPFSQADYYRTLAVFEPLRRPQVERQENSLAVDIDRGEGAQKIGLAALASPPRARLTAYIFDENPRPGPTRIFKRGDPTSPLRAVEPGVPAVLKPSPAEGPKPVGTTSGRRIWLARWLARADNPLTARVMVNRVWQWHFGRGLVASSNDFGTAGDPPSHPELLDWLASEFVANGWSLKSLHRLIVTSDAYRRSSDATEEVRTADADNVLLSRWPRRRLEAEAVRDSILAVSGSLNLARGGPSVFPAIPRAVLECQSRPGEGWKTSTPRDSARRSVYVFAKRSLALPELELLDTPDTTTSCERRPVSTTGPQALTYLNGEFIQEQARHLADRLRRDAGDDPARQIDLAFRLALGRAPRVEEARASARFLDEQSRLIRNESNPAPVEIEARGKALQAFALVVLNLNEFVYLD